MAVRLRLKRLGRTHRPFYRLAAMDGRTPRDGRVLEELGYYDPLVKDERRQVQIATDRVDYWLKVGAQPSETFQRLLDRWRASGAATEQRVAAIPGERDSGERLTADAGH